MTPFVNLFHIVLTLCIGLSIINVSRRGLVWRDEARRGPAGRGPARLGRDRHGEARLGTAGRGLVRQGKDFSHEQGKRQ